MGVGSRGSLRLGHKISKTVGNLRSPQCRNLGFGGLVCVEGLRVCARFLGGGGGWVLRLGGLGLGCWGDGVAVASCSLGRRLEAGAWGAVFFRNLFFRGRFGGAGDLGGQGFLGLRSTKHALLSSTP